MKHVKSFTLSTGATVLASQLAAELPAAYVLMKHVKSFTFRMGGMVLPSQLG